MGNQQSKNQPLKNCSGRFVSCLIIWLKVTACTDFLVGLNRGLSIVKLFIECP